VNILEERLRDAYRGAADTVRPERVPAPRWAREQVSRRGPSARRPTWRRLAPLAAAAAVVVVAVGAAVGLPRWLSGTGTTPAPAAPAGSPPEFMVIATDVASGGPAPLRVQDAATGRMVATVSTPQADTIWTAVADTGNDSTFILAAAPKIGGCSTLLYKLTLTAAGAPASLTPLDVPRISGFVSFNDLAATANGIVAFATYPCAEPADTTTIVGIIDTATAQIKRWTIPPGWFISGDLSLSADGGKLAFGIPGTSASEPGIPGVWVLSTSSVSGAVVQRAHRIARPPSASIFTGPVLISPDGSTVYIVTSYKTATRYISRVAAYDAATGHLRRIVRTGWQMQVELMSADPDVDHAVAWNARTAEPAELDLITGQVRSPRFSLPRGFFAASVAW
jgi:hypothetical protein